MVLYALACLIGSYWGLRFYGDTGFLFRELLDPEFPAGAFTACSGGFLLWAGWTWIAVGRDRADRWAMGLGIGLAYLGLDDVLQVHEGLTRLLVALGVPRPLGLDQDVLVFAAYAMALAPCLLAVLPRVRAHRTGLRLFLLALGLAAASQALDLAPWDRLSTVQRQWFGACEETTKTLATLAFALASAALRNGR